MPDSISNGRLNCEALRAVTGETVRPGGYLLTRQAIGFCELKPGSRVLDVGCGTGASVEYLIREFQLAAMGIDPSNTMLGLGISRCDWLPITKGWAENIDLASASMDAVLTECSLSHFSDCDKALKEFHRVLGAKGWLIVSDLYNRPKPENLKQGDIENSDLDLSLEGSFMKMGAIFKLMTANNFEVVLWEDHTDKLKQLSVDIIIKYGSMAKFWENSCQYCQSRCVTNLGKNVRLGYYLLIAKKKR